MLESKKAANKKWNARNLDRIEVQLRKGTKDRWKAAAAAAGLSMSQMVDTAVTEWMARNGGPGEN